MAEPQQAPVVIMQSGQKNSKGKTIFSIILIIILITLGFYGFFWASSDIGKQKLSDWKYTLSEYNPLTWYGEQLKTAGEIGRVWETDTKKDAEKVGIIFEAFEAVGSKIVPSGSLVAFKYKLDVGEGVRGTPLKLECNIKKDGKEITDLKPTIRPSEPKIYTDNPLSYSGILCQVNTKEEKEDLTIIAEGKISFPYERQRGSLRVYFTKDTQNIGNKFFEKYGIKEKLPIRATYNNEPVELGIGVNDEGIQPIMVGDEYSELGISPPKIGFSLKNKWAGKVTKVREINLYLPKEIKINKEFSPPSTKCPFGEPISSGEDYIKYKAKTEYLNQLMPFGKGLKEVIRTYEEFYCWVEIDESILGGSLYVQDQYSIDISYDYEFQPKTETITLKSIKKGGEGTTSTTPEYYLCIESETLNSKCVTDCGDNCGEGCTAKIYDSKEDCEGDLQQ